MLYYIHPKADFLREKDILKRIFDLNVELPGNLFVESFTKFYAIEFDLIYDEVFFECLQTFTRTINNNNFTFYTIAPSPENYFFKHFSKYNVAKIPVDCPYEDYITFLHKDPGQSPADALLHNAITVALYSENSNWGIIGDKDWEIAIVGFTNQETADNFFYSFDGSIYIETIKDRAEVIDGMVKLTEQRKRFYADLDINHLSK